MDALADYKKATAEFAAASESWRERCAQLQSTVATLMTAPAPGEIALSSWPSMAELNQALHDLDCKKRDVDSTYAAIPEDVRSMVKPPEAPRRYDDIGDIFDNLFGGKRRR